MEADRSSAAIAIYSTYLNPHSDSEINLEVSLIILILLNNISNTLYEMKNTQRIQLNAYYISWEIES